MSSITSIVDGKNTFPVVVSMETRNPHTEEAFAEVCMKVKNVIPDEVGRDTWLLIIATVLTASPQPELLGSFYTYLTRNEPAFSDPESQRQLSLRLRDVLLKMVTLVGAPQVLCALIPLAKVEGDPPAKAAESTRSEKWNGIDVSTIHARGTQTINSIYGPTLLPKIFDSFGSHSQDIQFMELFTVYGMYLSDFTLLGPIETETVVLTGITCTGLRGPSLWHVRGLGRLLGARGSDDSTEEMSRIKDRLRNVKIAIMTVVEFVGEEMVRRSGLGSEMGWVNLGDVVRELGGWGDDER